MSEDKIAKSAWSPGQLPVRSEQVRNLANTVLGTPTLAGDLNTFFDNEISRLKIILDTVKQQEDEFYNSLKLPRGAKGLKALQDKMDTLNNDLGFRGMTNLYDPNVKGEEYLIGEYISLQDKTVLRTMQQEWDNEITFKVKTSSDFGRNLIELQKNNIPGLTRGMLGEMINKVRGKKGISQFRFNQKTKQTGIITSVPEKETILIIQEEKEKKTGDNYIRVKVAPGTTFSDKVVESMRSDLQAEIDILFKQNSKENKEEILKKQVIIKIINQIKKRMTNEKLKTLLNKEKKRLYAYDYSSLTNPAILKGVLGELKTVIFLNYLFGSSAAAIPTGALQNKLSNNQEISIDVIVNGVGFQIKNYRLDSQFYKGDFRSKNTKSMKMGNFINDRARVGHSGVEGVSQEYKNLLTSLYGSFQFNQTASWSKNYADTRNTLDWAASLMKATELFKYKADNILKIADLIQVDSDKLTNFFIKPDLYFNTFFVISNKIVPSSLILQEIIEALKGANPKNAFSFDIVSISEPSNKYTYENIVSGKDGKRNWKELYEQKNNAKKAANLVEVKYDIRFDINSILQKALSQVQ